MSRFKNLQELFLSASARFAGRTAFRHIVGGKVRETSYADLPGLTYRASRALYAHGLRPGGRLVIWAPNSPLWVIAALGAFRIGAAVVPLDARAKADDIRPVLEQVEPTLILAGDRQLVRAGADARVLPLDDLLAEADDVELPHLPSPGPDDPALIVFTSGSTTAAKGVVLSHGNVVANVVAVAGHFDVDTNDRLLSVLPLSHMLEFTGGLMGPLHKGATIVYSQVNGPAHLRQLLKIERVSVLLGTPLLFQALLQEIEKLIEKLPRSRQIAVRLSRKFTANEPRVGDLLFKALHAELGGTIKFWLSGGAHTPDEVVSGLRSLGIRLYTGYGLTEASPIVSANSHRFDRAGSVGRPITGVEVRISGSASDAAGEVLVQGPNVMRGYLNNEKATTASFADGWLRTGDCGRLDGDGYLYLTGRLKSVIVSPGGLNIYPEELEAALAQSALIKESCVFGRPGKGGEAVSAAIVVHPSLDPKPDSAAVLKAEIAAALAGLADFKRLSDYQVWRDDLPRTATGKVRRGEVARLYEERSQSAKRAPAVSDPSRLLDDVGLKVCRTVARTMDPAILRAINPSGSHILSPDSLLSADLELDSFARLQLALELEQEFALTLPEDATQEAQSIEDLVVLVKRAQSSPHSHPTAEGALAGPVPASGWPSEWKPWPLNHAAAIDWPHRDEPFVVAGRRAFGVGMKVFTMIYNQLLVSGSDRLMFDPPYIIVANHVSHFDTVAILSTFPAGLLRLVHPVAAADYFFSDPVRAALSTYLINAVPFDRHGKFAESLESCERLLRKGEILIIFPEGTRSVDGKMGRFKPGAARLAIAVGCPVIPAYIEGTHEILPKGGSLPRPERLKITYGLPVYPPSGKADMEACHDFTLKLEQAIEALSPRRETVDQPS